MKTTHKAFAQVLAAGLFVLSSTGPLLTDACAADGKTTTPQKPRELTAAVVRCDDKALVVSNTKGKETTFVITIETRFGPIGSLKNPEDFRPGNHVHVTYVKGEGGKLVAQQVVPILTHVFK